MKTLTQKGICTAVVTAVFTISKTWKQPKCPQADEWVNKSCYTHMLEYYLAVKNQGNPTICNNRDGS